MDKHLKTTYVGPYSIVTSRDGDGRLHTRVCFYEYSASAAAVENGSDLSDENWNEHAIEDRYVQPIFDRIEKQEEELA